MSLIKILNERYPEDSHSKQLGSDPTKEVYFLTSRKHSGYAILYNFPDIFWEDFTEEDPQLAKLIEDKIGGEPEREDIREHYKEIGKENIRILVDFIEMNIDDYQYEVPHDFTSHALSFTEVLKNEWLIHFSDYAYNIMIDGFTKGASDPTRLSLTTWLGDTEKEIGGFNFAYQQGRADRYGRLGGSKYKYGKEAVLFKVEKAIQCQHWGDEEPQVIFWGQYASNITYIEYYEAEYRETTEMEYVEDLKTIMRQIEEDRYEIEPDEHPPEVIDFIEYFATDSLFGINDLNDLNEYVDLSKFEVEIDKYKDWPLPDEFNSLEDYSDAWWSILNAFEYMVDDYYYDKWVLKAFQSDGGKPQVVWEEVREGEEEYMSEILDSFDTNLLE